MTLRPCAQTLLETEVALLSSPLALVFNQIVSKMYSMKFRRLLTALFTVLLCSAPCSVQGQIAEQGVVQNMRNSIRFMLLFMNGLIDRTGSGGIFATNAMCDMDIAVESIIAAHVRSCVPVRRVWLHCHVLYTLRGC